MFEKFTEHARKVMSLSREEAQRLNSEFIGTEHLLLGIIRQGAAVAAKVLKNLNVDVKRVHQEIDQLNTGSTRPALTLGQLPFSPRAKRVIELAGEAASQIGHDVIGTEHLLLGLLKENEGIAAVVLKKLGLKLDDVHDMVLQVLGADVVDPPPIVLRLPSRQIEQLQEAEPLRDLIHRSPVADPIARLLREGLSVAITGPAGAGKTSALLAMAARHCAAAPFISMDVSLFDALGMWALRLLPLEPHARYVPEGELLTATRSDAVERLFDYWKQGERLVVEFRDEGWDAFTRQFPDRAALLTPVAVAEPDDRERSELLQTAAEMVQSRTGLRVPKDVLRQADELAARTITKPPSPWAVIRAIREAAAAERKRLIPRDIEVMRREIEFLEKGKNEAISMQEFEKAAQLRDRAVSIQKKIADGVVSDVLGENPTLSWDAVRAALQAPSS